jgi:hypothetical protein
MTRICEECGNNGEGGEIEYADGRLAHFRKFPDDGKPHPIMCFGKFVEKEDALTVGDVKAEALRRYPDPPQGSESSTPVLSNATMYTAGQAREVSWWKCKKCGARVADPLNGGHICGSSSR